MPDEGYADKIIDAITTVDNGDTSMLYVQSFVVAEFGEPIARYRWDDGRYVREELP